MGAVGLPATWSLWEHRGRARARPGWTQPGSPTPPADASPLSASPVNSDPQKAGFDIGWRGCEYS